MIKYLIALGITGMLLAAPLFAQDNSLDLFKQIDKMDSPSPSPAASGTQNPAAQQAMRILFAGLQPHKSILHR